VLQTINVWPRLGLVSAKHLARLALSPEIPGFDRDERFVCLSHFLARAALSAIPSECFAQDQNWIVRREIRTAV
jgi:hypothetical protein